jgi:transcriptional regulator GlxA family with amidase domain
MLAEALSAQSGGARPVAPLAVAPLGIVRRASSRQMRIYDSTVYEALEKIRLHACDGLQPSDIAKDFPVSRRMAEIRFKAATGKTIGDELLERRLAVACDYLREGRSSVAAIANFCGWNSDVAFRKAFKDRFGLSPLQWRATNH